MYYILDAAYIRVIVVCVRNVNHILKKKNRGKIGWIGIVVSYCRKMETWKVHSSFIVLVRGKDSIATLSVFEDPFV